jgi:hypothetical protein
MFREKLAADQIGGGRWFSEKNMRHRKRSGACSLPFDRNSP